MLGTAAVLCLTGDFYGQNGNRILTLANAISLADAQRLPLAVELHFWDWALTLFNQTELTNFFDVSLKTQSTVCNRSITTKDSFYTKHAGFHPILARLRPNEHIRERAVAQKLVYGSSPLVTVHIRGLNGQCKQRASLRSTFCFNKTLSYEYTCHYTPNAIRAHFTFLREKGLFVALSDGENKQSEANFVSQSGLINQLPFFEQMWLASISDYHFGNPMSSIDYVVAQWRGLYHLEPRSCYQKLS